MLDLLLIGLMLFGCETAKLLPDAVQTYQKDLEIYESGTKIVGLGVLQPKPSYNFDIRSRHNPDLVRISNCHRDLVLRDQKKQFNFPFAPNKAVENGSCVLLFTMLDSKGFHQFGGVVFRENDETLSSTVACNGAVDHDYVGASVCQGKVGTIQSIAFSTDDVAVKTSCPPPRHDGKRWFITLAEGFCLFLFKSDKDEFHKLTTFGYNDVIQQ